MAADAIPWVAVGTLLVIGYVVVRAIVLAQVALRDGGEVEVEVKAPSLSLRVRAGRPCSYDTYNHGDGTNTARAGLATAKAPEKGHPRQLEKE